MAKSAANHIQRPRVSFVVPCYKLSHLLSECLTSLLAQSYSDFEIIVMDDCSPDSTGEVTKSFSDPRITYVRNETNLGNIRNFNKGIQAAKGDYVWLISADDCLRSSRILERYVALMDSHPEVGYVFCQAMALLENGEEKPLQTSHYADTDLIIPKGDYKFLSTLTRNEEFHMTAPTVMIRKDCYEKISYFPEDLPHRADTYIWTMFAMQYGVAYMVEPMVNYRLHSSSMSALLNFAAALKDDFGVLWRTKKAADQSGNYKISACCISALINLYIRHLSGLFTVEDFEASLSAAGDEADKRRVRRSVYSRLGDESRWKGSPDRAIQMYARSLGASGKMNLRVWAKLFVSVFKVVQMDGIRGLTRLAGAS